MEFVEFTDWLSDLGIQETLLPFLLIFTVCYAALTNRLFIGNKHRGINMVIAAILALVPVLLHVTGKAPADKDAIEIINASLPMATLVAIGLVAALILIGIFFSAPKMDMSGIGLWVPGLAALIFINFAFPGVPLWVAVLSGWILVAAAAKKGTSNVATSSVVFLIITFILLHFGQNMGYFQQWPNWTEDPRTLMFYIAGFTFIGVAVFITRGDE